MKLRTKKRGKAGEVDVILVWYKCNTIGLTGNARKKKKAVKEHY